LIFRVSFTIRGVSNVSSYRVYSLDGAGRLELPDWIEAADDAQALCQAQELKNHARKCEVWQGKRLVAALNREDSSEAA